MWSNKDRINKVKRLLGLTIDEDKRKDDKKHYYRVADVICDLKHYCDKFKIDFSNEIRMSNIFYEEEIEITKNLQNQERKKENGK
tara:strand:- start:422 stop:676 length:255 start_codon:yes stop_codon:yes gene_type:complete